MNATGTLEGAGAEEGAEAEAEEGAGVRAGKSAAELA